MAEQTENDEEVESNYDSIQRETCQNTKRTRKANLQKTLDIESKENTKLQSFWPMEILQQQMKETWRISHQRTYNKIPRRSLFKRKSVGQNTKENKYMVNGQAKFGKLCAAYLKNEMKYISNKIREVIKKWGEHLQKETKICN